MKMIKKRIMIFSPEGETQKKIERTVLEALSKMLKMYPVEFEGFAGIDESYNKNKQIGAGNEVFVVFDNYLEIKEKRKLTHQMIPEEKLYAKCLRQGIIAAQNLCDDLSVPYVMYEGEVHTGQAIVFRERIQSLEGVILRKILETSADETLHVSNEVAEEYPNLDKEILDSIKIR